MCATGASSPANDISAYWTDTEIIQFLVNLQQIPGFPLPSNVHDYLNPFQYEPSNLPQGEIWYLVLALQGSKRIKGGVWIEKGEACRIIIGSLFTGWRRTHEFCGGAPTADDARKTGCWMMQEYWISCEDPIYQMDSTRSLCRVFMCDGEDGNKGLPNKNDKVAVPDNDSKPGQPAISAVQVEKAIEDEYFTVKDFLELADLDSPLSPSSTDNSSPFSRVTDEYFDSEAFLHELTHGDEAYSQPRPVGHQLNVSRTSADVVLSVTSEASSVQERIVPSQPIRVEVPVATSAHDNEGLFPDKDRNKRKAEVPASLSTGALSNSGDSVASSSRQRPPGSERGKKVHIGKSIQKFFCFLT